MKILIFLALLLMPAMAIAGVNPVLQTPYTTNTQAAADAHVLALDTNAPPLPGYVVTNPWPNSLTITGRVSVANATYPDQLFLINPLGTVDIGDAGFDVNKTFEIVNDGAKTISISASNGTTFYGPVNGSFNSTGGNTITNNEQATFSSYAYPMGQSYVKTTYTAGNTNTYWIFGANASLPDFTIDYYTNNAFTRRYEFTPEGPFVTTEGFSDNGTSYPGSNVFNFPVNATNAGNFINGNISGNGAGLTNVSAQSLNGYPSNSSIQAYDLYGNRFFFVNGTNGTTSLGSNSTTAFAVNDSGVASGNGAGISNVVVAIPAGQTNLYLGLAYVYSNIVTGSISVVITNGDSYGSNAVTGTMYGNIGGVTFNTKGSFSGNGTGLTNCVAAGFTNGTANILVDGGFVTAPAAGFFTLSIECTNSQVVWLTNATSHNYIRIGTIGPPSAAIGVTNLFPAFFAVNASDSIAVTNISGSGGSRIDNSFFQAFK